MAILNMHGHKRTANEFAKELLLSMGERAFMWKEHINEVYLDQYTEKQMEDVDARIDYQYGRVFAFFGHPRPERSKEDTDGES